MERDGAVGEGDGSWQGSEGNGDGDGGGWQEGVVSAGGTGKEIGRWPPVQRGDQDAGVAEAEYGLPRTRR